MTDKPTAQSFEGPNGRLAYLQQDGADPGVVWLGGYASDMRGTKAEAIAEWCEERGRAYLRFDYSGHGESDGDFEDGTIGSWTKDAAAIVGALRRWSAPGTTVQAMSSPVMCSA